MQAEEGARTECSPAAGPPAVPVRDDCPRAPLKVHPTRRGGRLLALVRLWETPTRVLSDGSERVSIRVTGPTLGERRTGWSLNQTNVTELGRTFLGSRRLRPIHLVLVPPSTPGKTNLCFLSRRAPAAFGRKGPQGVVTGFIVLTHKASGEGGPEAATVLAGVLRGRGLLCVLCSGTRETSIFMLVASWPPQAAAPPPSHPRPSNKRLGKSTGRRRGVAPGDRPHGFHGCLVGTGTPGGPGTKDCPEAWETGTLERLSQPQAEGAECP